MSVSLKRQRILAAESDADDRHRRQDQQQFAQSYMGFVVRNNCRDTVFGGKRRTSSTARATAGSRCDLAIAAGASTPDRIIKEVDTDRDD